MATVRRYKGALVDLAAGLISREIFVNEDIYRRRFDRSSSSRDTCTRCKP